MATRPFHETIVDAIRRITDKIELCLFAILIKETTILENHDEIIAAWKEKSTKVSGTDGDVYGVVASLIEQKKEVEQKAARDATWKEQMMKGGEDIGC